MCLPHLTLCYWYCEQWLFFDISFDLECHDFNLLNVTLHFYKSCLFQNAIELIEGQKSKSEGLKELIIILCYNSILKDTTHKIEV